MNPITLIANPSGIYIRFKIGVNNPKAIPKGMNDVTTAAINLENLFLFLSSMFRIK